MKKYISGYQKIVLCLLFILLSNYIAFSQCSNEKSGCSNCDLKSKHNTKIAQKDEFETFEEFKEGSNNKTNSNEFQEFKTDTTKTENQIINREDKYFFDKLMWPLGALFFTILAGVFVRFKPTRKLRGIFLVSSIVFLGFYSGACPCPISSFSNVIIGISGGVTSWVYMVWFLGLIPITYIFGKTWCGWICHLGALQRFLFMSNKFDFLRSEKSRKIMKIMQYFFTIALIVQVVATQTYLFDVIDPFRVAYNLGFGANLTGWVLLGLLLLTSLFINRPFCKSACPIGLTLGWISKIPGASVIGENGKCVGCNLSSKACKMDAIVRQENHSILDNKECIACGDCFESCNKDALSFFRKNKNHSDVVKLCRKDRKPDTVEDFFDREFSE